MVHLNTHNQAFTIATVSPNMSHLYPFYLFSEDAWRLFSSGVPSHDFCRNVCSACAVTVVIFRQWNGSFHILTQYTTLTPLPAPQIPVGRRPQCIQSFFILWTNRSAVSSTLRVLSPNWRLWANRWMYRHGSTPATIISSKLVNKDFC